MPTSEFDAQRFFTDPDYTAPVVERNAALVEMYAGGGSSGTISRNRGGGTGIPVLDDGGNGPPGSTTGGNGGGGGGPGDGSNGGRGGDNRRITSEEKFALKGRVIKQSMMQVLGQKGYEKLNGDPFKEMTNLMAARQVLEDPSCPY